jgi:hypothetical protein
MAAKFAGDCDRRATALLSKLAAAGSTGVLPVTAPAAGAIYLKDGAVVCAESVRTPGPATPPRNPSGLSAMLATTESSLDAAFEILASDSNYAKFRPLRVPPSGALFTMPVDDLLCEVARRRRLLRQMTGFTADTPLARNPNLGRARIQLSAHEWALLVRVRGGSTPRDLAWALDRSVFGTTTDTYRLIGLGLLAAQKGSIAARERPAPPTPRPGAAAGLAGLSFIIALSDEKGSGEMSRPANSASRTHRGG